MNVKFRLGLDDFEFKLTDSVVVEELLGQKKIDVALLDHFGRLYEGDLRRMPNSDGITTNKLLPGNIYIDLEKKRLVIPYEVMGKLDRHYVHVAEAVDLAGLIAFLKTADQELDFRWKR